MNLENKIIEPIIFDPTYTLDEFELKLWNDINNYDKYKESELPEIKMAMKIIGLSYNQDKNEIIIEKNVIELNEETIFGINPYKEYLNKGFIKPCLPMALLNISGNAIEYFKVLQNLGFESFVGNNIEETLSISDNEAELDNILIKNKQTIQRVDPSVLYELDSKGSCHIFKSCPFIKSKILRPVIIGRSCLFYLNKCLKYYVENKVKYTNYFQQLHSIQDTGLNSIIEDISKQIAMMQAENEIIINSRVTGGVEVSEEITNKGVMITTVADPSNKTLIENIKQIEALEKKTGIDNSKLLDFTLRKRIIHIQNDLLNDGANNLPGIDIITAPTTSTYDEIIDSNTIEPIEETDIVYIENLTPNQTEEIVVPYKQNKQVIDLNDDLLPKE